MSRSPRPATTLKDLSQQNLVTVPLDAEVRSASGSRSPSQVRTDTRPLLPVPQSPGPSPNPTPAPGSLPGGSTTVPPGPYHGQITTGSSDMLLPPVSPHRVFRSQESPLSSRRSSWSAEASLRISSFVGPIDVSVPPSRAGSPIFNGSVTSLRAAKFNVVPSPGLLLYPDDKEDDDVLHDPAFGMDESSQCDVFTKRGLINVGGLFLITAGVLLLFIGFPVLTFLRNTVTKPQTCKYGDMCLDVGPVDLLNNHRRSLIDPDTPESAMYRESADGKKLELVFSDEFNTDGRTFYPTEDAYWEAVDIHYEATQDLEWYDPDAITTRDGYLEIEFAAHPNHNLDYRSGMLQSWNKLCFKGGLIEASISLPGRGDVSGLWPGFWTMGNLGRPGYLSTTEGMWPYSYHDECDAGITANQSSTDGISFLPGMKLPGCTCVGQDHPNRGKARSSPEIDIIEASVSKISSGKNVGIVSQSMQVAPFDLWYQPNYSFMELYHPEFTAMNAYRGGFFQQAISGVSVLNNDWYEGKQYQRYGFEYIPGDDGYIVWNIGDLKMFKTTGAATGPNGNVGQRPIPNEPLSIIVNVGMSNSFAYVDFEQLATLFPTKMRIDWVRVWQDPDCKDCSVTCDPPNYPTTDYINDHKIAYMNPNVTKWADTTYDWPKNTFVHKCE